MENCSTESISEKMKENYKTFQSGLYVVATPIGNLGDITNRAIEVFQQVDMVAAEDTRVSKKLLDHYKVNTKLISLHEHSSRSQVQALINRLNLGESIAYVSDAGTPGVSDPGRALVAAAREAGVAVFAVPGASAVTALVSIAPFEFDRFTFHGFLPRKKTEIYITDFCSSAGLHIFYESPKRIGKSLAAIAGVYPDLPCMIGREMTKLHDQSVTGSAAELAAMIGGEIPEKGEFVLAFYRSEAAEAGADWQNYFRELISLGVGRKALLRIGKEQGLARNEVYAFYESEAE